jgi:hypothetical protein
MQKGKTRPKKKKKETPSFKGWMFSLIGWRFILELGSQSRKYHIFFFKKIKVSFYKIFHVLHIQNLDLNPVPDLNEHDPQSPIENCIRELRKPGEGRCHLLYEIYLHGKNIWDTGRRV